jgi:hypothetical protein
VYLPKDRVDGLPAHDRSDRGIMRVSGEFVWVGSTRNDAYTLEHDGVVYVCPRYPRLRMLEGIVSFRDDHPGSALAPEPAAQRALRELVRIRTDAPSVRSHILTSPWHVPLRWFACFSQDERELRSVDEGLTIRYRTLLADAIDRIERSIEVLEEAGFDQPVVDEVAQLAEWLSAFPTNGVLELDYHTVAGLFDDGSLAFDESAAEVHRSLGALSRLDYEAAGEAYTEVARRWAPYQALAYVN